MSSVSAVFVNRRTEIERVVELAERFAGEHQLPADIVMTIHLVLDEVVANIIAHGYDDTAEHQIHVTLALDESVLTIRVEDDGRPFDPLAAPPPDLDLPLEERPVGGLGIHIVRSVMDAVEYHRDGDRNQLIMKKTIGRSA
jgi:anti-sigma regulatory factor (Ser/Thr protein kinase)